jgi:putative transposase
MNQLNLNSSDQGSHSGPALFLTYRIYGALPRETMRRIAVEKRHLANETRSDESPGERARRIDKILFAMADDALDTAHTNPRWLDNTLVAEAIQENLFFHANKSYRLWAFVVMPNHVHALVEPIKQLGQHAELVPDSSQIVHSLKSFTAHRANEILNRKGVFWETATYEQWIRDAAEFSRTIEYIERNPVKARFVSSPKKWLWSSAANAREADGTCANRK